MKACLRNFAGLCTLALLIALMLSAPLSTANAQVNPAPTATAQPVEVSDPSPNDVREFRRLLADPSMQKWLLDESKEAEVGEEAEEGPGFREVLAFVADRIRGRLANLRQATMNIDQAPGIITQSWQERVSGTDTLRMVTYVLIFLFVGAGFEWLYVQYTGQRLLAHELSKPDGLGERLRSAFSRAIITFGGLAVFAIGSIGTYLSFDWPEIIDEIVLNVLIVILVLRIATTIVRFFRRFMKIFAPQFCFSKLDFFSIKKPS